MLSAQKVLLHGMSDKRWTTKDKVNQYKGLVPLYQRDKVIAGYDKTAVKKQQQKICRRLQKSLMTHRQALDNCIYGDRQEIRNCLDVDQRLKRAYQDLPIEVIVDRIHQENFNLRKTLDRLMHKIKLKTEKLIKCKLDIAAYEDILKEIQKSNKIEIKSKEISASVQDVTLKKEAAIRVGVIYRKIISYMRKDCVYFDAVLNSIQLDVHTQNDCMLQAITLGQMATEQRDDRTIEYHKVLHAVNQYRELCKHENANLFYKTKSMKAYMLKSKEQLHTIPQHLGLQFKSIEFRKVEDMLNALKEITNTSKVFEILPCMESQKKNSIKLNEMIEKLKKGKEILTNKLNHAKLSHMNYICVNDEPSYKQEVQRLEDTIKQKNDEIKETKKHQAVLNDVCTKLDAAIKQIQIKCNPIHVKKEIINKNKPAFISYYDQYPFTKHFDEIWLKICYLDFVYPDLDPHNIPKRAESFYKNLLKPADSGFIKITKKIESYLQFAKPEDAIIPTREGVKQNSLEYANKAKTILENL